MTRLPRAAAVLVPVLMLAACTSGNVAAEPSSPRTSESATQTPATTPVTTPSVTSTSTSPSPAATSTTAAASSPAVPQAPAFTTTCRTLSVRVLKGGGIRGMEIAALQFVNDGTASCTVTGTPTARLLRRGTPVGTPSQPTGARVRPFTVAPGDYAESLLRVNSTCNAPLSDNLRLRLPARGDTAGRTRTEPIELRACAMTVAPAGAPA